MKAEEAKAVIAAFQKQCADAVEVARTARRNSKSLAGENFYGRKFHDLTVALTQSEARLRKVVAAVRLEANDADALTRQTNVIKSVGATAKERADALKHVRLVCQSVLLPGLESMTANPVPLTEQVLPLSVVEGTRPYLERIITQANGCYEHQWYDACSVMIRKFVEILIIEVYEAHGKAGEIKDGGGDFLMLRDLVTRILAQSHWNLSRETKRELPNIKKLGDRSAHNRRYVATKQDVDGVLSGLRVIADDLLHLANLK
ncbi:MAG TPA: DUF4145 domain-containing protein [Pyrinomonadaceae bacterium]|jgi:hypothetical protein